MVGMPTVDQHWPNVGMMLALCPQHWPDVGAGGHWYVGPTSHQWLADGWPNIGPSSAQHWHVYGVPTTGVIHCLHLPSTKNSSPPYPPSPLFLLLISLTQTLKIPSNNKLFPKLSTKFCFPPKTLPTLTRPKSF